MHHLRWYLSRVEIQDRAREKLQHMYAAELHILPLCPSHALKLPFVFEGENRSEDLD